MVVAGIVMCAGHGDSGHLFGKVCFAADEKRKEKREKKKKKEKERKREKEREQEREKERESVCSVSALCPCAQGMTFCSTLKGCGSHIIKCVHSVKLKAMCNVQVWRVDGQA